jgi:thiamine biosynthesis lipoprotein
MLLLALSCGRQEGHFLHLTGQAQGTTFNIRYDDPQERDFSGPVDSLFRLIDHSMSLWDTSSIITAMNRNSPDAKADEHFSRVFKRSLAVSAETGGAFDITVGPLVRAWGFSIKKNLPPPDSAAVDSLRRLIGYQKVSLTPDGRLQKADTAMQVDVNAIAQGYTVDLIAEFLTSQGIKNFMVEVGGEVRTAGLNDRGQPWQIGIDKPVSKPEEGRPLQVLLGLSNKSLATSGSYRKFVERNGRRYSHAIDPLTGYPVQHTLLSVSVLAEDCATADAYATAFLVMGLEKAMETAAAKQMDVYCVYHLSGDSLGVRSTPGFEKIMVKGGQ